MLEDKNFIAMSNRQILLQGADAGGFDLPFKHGGKIHINPANRGKFNATKAATGKSTEELTHSSNPVTKKRAVFAQNASHWKHGDGGLMEGIKPIPGDAPQPMLAEGGRIGTGSTRDWPGQGYSFSPVTAFSEGGSLNPRHNPMMPGGSDEGLGGRVPPGGIQAPILMYNTGTDGREAVLKALRRMTPLPQGANGMKFANSQFGDKTILPKSYQEGGEMDGPGLGKRIAGVFNPNIRTDNRYQAALNRALSGKGSQDFKTASEFTIPTSGVTTPRGSRILITPQQRNVVTQPGTPGTAAVPGTPARTEQYQTGTKREFTPEFTETGHGDYGSHVEGAPHSGSYSHFPEGMNPGLKAALQKGILDQSPTVDWKGKQFKAGKFTETPEFAERTIPGTPEIPAVPGTPGVTETQTVPFVRSGGVEERGGFWKKRQNTDLDWIKQGALGTSSKGSLKYKTKTTSAR